MNDQPTEGDGELNPPAGPESVRETMLGISPAAAGKVPDFAKAAHMKPTGIGKAAREMGDESIKRQVEMLLGPQIRAQKKAEQQEAERTEREKENLAVAKESRDIAKHSRQLAAWALAVAILALIAGILIPLLMG